MRHHNNKRKFGRETDARRALLRSLARSLVLHNKIRTTEAKAKEIRPLMEKMITTGKIGTLEATRRLVAEIGKQATQKVVKELSKTYASRHGGYTRITKLPARKSDGAAQAIIEFV